MSSFRNPSVGVESTSDGFVAGYQGGRPPDGVVVLAASVALERQGSPVAPEFQAVPKTCRTTEEEMVLDDIPLDGVRVSGDLEGIAQTPTMPAVNLNPAPSVPSFKDKLMGATGASCKQSNIADLDVEVRAKDVRLGGISTLPEIFFSDRVYNEGTTLWNPSGDMCLINLDNDYYLARFALEEDFQKVLTGGPWVIYGSYLMVQLWSRNFSTTEAHPSHLMVWVRLPKLMYMFCTKSLFRHIAAAIGKVVRVDYNTTEGKRGRFARLAIIVGLNKPLVSGIIIDGYRPDVEYEGLPAIYYKCGKFGHSKDHCSGDNPAAGSKEVVTEKRNPIELYGPRMQVVNRRRQPGTTSMKQVQGVGAGPSKVTGGSRFEVLDEEGGDVSEVDEVALVQNAAAGGMMGELRSERIGGYEGDRREVAQLSPHAHLVENREAGGVPLREATMQPKENLAVASAACAVERGSATQVVPNRESIEPRPAKGSVLPTTIRGVAPKGGAKKGVGNPVVTKLGVKQKKRDERGPTKHGLLSCLANLVLDLDRAVEAEKHRELAEQSRVIEDIAPAQWRTNSVFEQPGESDMQGALDPGLDKSFKLMVRNHVPDIMAVFEPRISGRAADSFIRRSGFEYSYRVEAHGFSSGIWILWRGSVHIDVLVFQAASRKWNNEVFGHIELRKRKILASLKGIERVLDLEVNPYLEELEKELKRELDVVLTQEESLWHQKARGNWIAKGDRNTRFFHLATMSHRKRNTIQSLKIDGRWVTDQSRLREHTVEFFQTLYSTEPRVSGGGDNESGFTPIPEGVLATVNRPVTMDEIRKIVFSMDPLKAPGVDGLHAAFYQKNWDTVGFSVFKFVKKFFSTGILEEWVNYTLLVLIPKVEVPSCIQQFRPISLCTVLYKIITKTLVCRLKAFLAQWVSSTQASFVPGRHITDNIIIAQEVIHSMVRKGGRKSWIAIKVDLKRHMIV
ncbi:hypothetical protein GQ457_15G016700 [Hibiscus cannabinus]